jgi:hypothetical protein
MVTRQQRVDDLWEDGVFVSHNPGKEWLTGLQAFQEVGPDFFSDRASPERSLRPAAVLQFTNGAWLDHDPDRSAYGNRNGGCKRFIIKELNVHLDKAVQERTFATRLCPATVTDPVYPPPTT